MPVFNVNGVNYDFPEPKQKKWGNPLTNWASAITTQLNQVIGQVTVINSPYTPVTQVATGKASLALVLNDPYLYDPDLLVSISPISTEKVTFSLTNLDPLLPTFADLQTDGEMFVQIRKDGVAVSETKVGFDAIGQSFLPMQFTYEEILAPGSHDFDIGLKFTGTAGTCSLSNFTLKALGGRV